MPRLTSFIGSWPLILRIYLACLALILVSVAATSWIGRYGDDQYRLRPQRRAHFVAERIAASWGRPDVLARELAALGEDLDATATVFSGAGEALATNVSPPLPPLALATRPPPRAAGESLTPAGGPRHRVEYATLPLPGDPLAYVGVGFTRPPPGRIPLLAGGLVLVLVAVASFVMARSIAVPLERVAAAARAIGAGELGVRLKLSRRDELGEVARAFDEMAERLSGLLRSQTELLANISHELRTPLARIRVALDLASEGDAALARESLADISDDLVELERLVDDVLTTARLDFAHGRIVHSAPPLRLETVEARHLVERAVMRFRSAHAARALDVELEPELPLIRADPPLLRRVLDNLLENARKYSDPQSRIAVHARREGELLRVDIRDAGMGIGEEDLRQVFNPFFRTDRSRARASGGMGLGLALARKIVEAHGGTVTLESQVDVGTVATVRVPILRETASA